MIFKRGHRAQVHVAFRMPPEQIMMPRHGASCAHREEAVFSGLNTVLLTKAFLDAVPARVRNSLTAVSRERLYSGIFDRITDIRDPSQLNAVVRDLDIVVGQTIRELERTANVTVNPLEPPFEPFRRGTARLVPIRQQERLRTSVELVLNQHLVRITEMVANIEQAIAAIERAVISLEQRVQ